MRQPIIETARAMFKDMVVDSDYLDKSVEITCKALTEQEAIGNPLHDDYPIQKGHEKLLEATFDGFRGQAFSDAYLNYSGTIKDILSLDLNTNAKRAIFISTLNAVLAHMGTIKEAVHCKDQQLLECRDCFREFVDENFQAHKKVLLVGLQPRLLSVLAESKDTRVCDLDPENIGMEKSGVTIQGPDAFEENALWADVVVATGSTVGNGTIDDILKIASEVWFFGVTIRGVATLTKLNQFCYLLNS